MPFAGARRKHFARDWPAGDNRRSDVRRALLGGRLGLRPGEVVIRRWGRTRARCCEEDEPDCARGPESSDHQFVIYVTKSRYNPALAMRLEA